MPLVELPDGRSVEFPDGASLSDIDAAIRRDFAQLFAPQTEERRKKILEERRIATMEGRLAEADVAVGNALGAAGEFLQNVPANILNIPQAISKATGLEPMEKPFLFQYGQPVLPELIKDTPELTKDVEKILGTTRGGADVPDANAAAIAGLLKGGEDIVRGLTTPEGMMAMGAGAAPGTIRSAAPTVFAEQMIQHTPEAYQEFGRASAEGTPAEVARAGVGALGSSAMVAGISTHGIQKIAAENVRVGNTETAKALAQGESNAIREQVPAEGVLRQERSEVGLPPVVEGKLQGQPTAEAATQATQEVASPVREQGTASAPPIAQPKQAAAGEQAAPVSPASRPERGLTETATESDLVADMTQAGREFLSAVQKTPDEFSALDATKLSEADRRNLARLGVSFAVDRKNKVLGIWPQSKRVETLRKTVLANRAARVTEPPTPQPESPAGALPKPSVTPEVTQASGVEPKEIVGQGLVAPTTSITTPAKAAKKVATEVKQVAKIEGMRPAKDVKAELVQRLEAEREKLMQESGITVRDVPERYEGYKNLKSWEVRNADNNAGFIDIELMPNGKIQAQYNSWIGKGTIEAKTQELALKEAMLLHGSSGEKITIEIPGDGTFTVFRSGKELTEVLNRARRIKTGTEAPKISSVATVATPEKVIKAYGTAEDAYNATVRQARSLDDAAAKSDAERFAREIYKKTKASALESKAETARTTAAERRSEMNESLEEIERINKLKKKTKAHLESIEHLTKRADSAKERMEFFERSAESFEQEAAKEKAKLESVLPPEFPPEIVGMGGAVPSEFEAKPSTPTSIKNAQVDVERAQRGLPPAIEPARRSFGRVWDDAMAKIDHDPFYPDALLDELRAKPRSLTDTEDAVLLRHQIDLQNEYGKATRDLAQAAEDAKTFPNRLDAVESEKARVAALSDQLLDLYNIGKKVGTETGRGLNARKMMAFEDYSLAKMELDRRAINDGKPLTESQQAEVIKLNQKIEQTQKAFDEYTAKAESQQAKLALDESISEVKRAARKGKPKDISTQQAETTAALREKFGKGERDDITSLVQRLARLFVEQGIRERDPLIDAVHGVLKELDPNFTRREAMDAISGYGRFRQLTKDEISVKLRDLKGQMQQVAKLEDMQANRPPLKTGMERRIPSPEESRLIKLVNQAKNEFQIPLDDPATQLKSSLDELKTRLKNRTIEFQDRLKRGDFEKKSRRIIQLDPEANRLHLEMSKAKAAWHEALMNDRLAKRSVPRKVFDTGVETINTARAIQTSMDLSAVLRQGGFIALAHPIRAAKSVPAMFRAFASEAGQHAVDREILARKNYPLYNQSKLYLSEHGQKLSQMEEAYMSRWADKIPLVAGSQRAYTTFLNKLRADSFDAMANSLARNKELTPAEAAAIANFINVATGRGNLGMKENALVGLNTVFFAPRYVASRFQLLAGQPFYRGSARTRIAIAQEYARYLAGVAIVYALALHDGAEVESDPRSSDFGKLKYGNTRLDPISGLAQTSILTGRMVSGETKRSTGKVVPIRGDKVPFGSPDSADVLATFARSKLAPVPGAIVNTLAGTDIVGQPVTSASTAKSLVTPLSFSEISQTMQEQGISRGTAFAILSIFGAGLQNYDAAKRPTTTP